MLIAIDVLSLHYDPKYWGPVDPNTFYPMRFAPENKINKLVFMAFGGGPRSCIGFYSYLEKIIIHYLIIYYF